MLTAFDIGVGILVLISALLATTRGLTREVLSLVTWAGAAGFAVWMYLNHPDLARQYVNDDLWADVATVVVSFLVALVILHLLTMRIGDWITDSRLGPLDRTLGFVFGALRGILIAVVVVIFGVWLMGGRDNLPDWAAEAQTLPTLEALGEGLISLLPQNLEEQVNDFLQGSGSLGETVEGGAVTNEDGAESTQPAPEQPAAEPAPAGDSSITEL
ncbi:CvpA family protein [Pelagibacterium xiamenense]|uniref:CvpA family protein n=1 Tax=Pelagibacterium xiamenense TaxID=2901140 RepID=UPI001E324D31|nr:CvpA family protein [Pelagibacterium xiamenense]MCD7059763.1 CvpA family protein [Pelagibacterium xiamenense]